MAGVTLIADSVAGVTVRVIVLLVTVVAPLVNEAVIVVLPIAWVVTVPLEATVATDVFELTHKTTPVTLFVELSEYFAVAVKCAGLPAATDVTSDVIVKDERLTAVTVSEAVLLVTRPETGSVKLAVMFVVPGVLVAVAKPVDAPMVALVVSELAQVTKEVIVNTPSL